MKPGWQRLWRHSYWLGFRWLGRGFLHGWKGNRVGLARILVPLDPVRYYELGRVADENFDGLNLDVSSPKLLASFLNRKKHGSWIAMDLYEREIRNWKFTDPDLPLMVCDATRLPCASEAFDHCICISVVEHLPDDGDTKALAEMWRVLKPAGVLHLTTNVAAESRDIFIDEPLYGKASKRSGNRVFCERVYSLVELEKRLLRHPWAVLHKEFARQIDRSIEARFFAHRPWSYLYGPALRWWCARNFETSGSPSILGSGEQGVVYLKLRKVACR
jgi:SAM-dependent methyltransferase